MGWVAVQRVTFVEDTGEVARRAPSTRPRNVARAAIALSYAAKTGHLDEQSRPTRAEYLPWSSYDAQHFVRSTLATLLGVVGNELANKLIRALGPTLAAVR
jgi:hypothetical protein